MQGIDLIVDKDIACAGHGQQQLEIVMEVQAAHGPVVMLAQLGMELDRRHKNLPLPRYFAVIIAEKTAR